MVHLVGTDPNPRLDGIRDQPENMRNLLLLVSIRHDLQSPRREGDDQIELTTDQFLSDRVGSTGIPFRVIPLQQHCRTIFEPGGGEAFDDTCRSFVDDRLRCHLKHRNAHLTPFASSLFGDFRKEENCRSGDDEKQSQR